MLYPNSNIVKISSAGSAHAETELSALVSNKTNQPEEIKDFKNPFIDRSIHEEGIQEQDAFKDRTEEKVPEIFLRGVKWLLGKGIDVEAFRKLLTPSCKAAIEARRVALPERNIEYRDEVKTLVFDAEDRSGRPGKITKVAVHLQGDSEIGGGYEKGMCEEVLTYLNSITELGSTKPIYDFRNVRMGSKTETLHGRQDPLSFLMNHPDGIQIFDKALKNEKRNRYANIGMNTWSVVFSDFTKVIDAIAHEAKVYIETDLVIAKHPTNQVQLQSSSKTIEPSTGRQAG